MSEDHRPCGLRVGLLEDIAVVLSAEPARVFSAIFDAFNRHRYRAGASTSELIQLLQTQADASGSSFEDNHHLQQALLRSLNPTSVASRGATQLRPPASQQAVDSLRTFCWTREGTVKRHALQEGQLTVEDLNVGGECPVCREDFTTECKATEMPCMHLFHTSCLRPWLKQTNSCPICRHELPTDDVSYEASRRVRPASSAGIRMPPSPSAPSNAAPAVPQSVPVSSLESTRRSEAEASVPQRVQATPPSFSHGAEPSLEESDEELCENGKQEHGQESAREARNRPPSRSALSPSSPSPSLRLLDRRSRAVIGGSNVTGSGPVAPVRARAGDGEDASCPETWTIRKLKGVLSLAGVHHSHCLTRSSLIEMVILHISDYKAYARSFDQDEELKEEAWLMRTSSWSSDSSFRCRRRAEVSTSHTPSPGYDLLSPSSEFSERRSLGVSRTPVTTKVDSAQQGANLLDRALDSKQEGREQHYAGRSAHKDSAGDTGRRVDSGEMEAKEGKGDSVMKRDNDMLQHEFEAGRDSAERKVDTLVVRVRGHRRAAAAAEVNSLSIVQDSMSLSTRARDSFVGSGSKGAPTGVGSASSRGLDFREGSGDAQRSARLARSVTWGIDYAGQMPCVSGTRSAVNFKQSDTTCMDSAKSQMCAVSGTRLERTSPLDSGEDKRLGQVEGKLASLQSRLEILRANMQSTRTLWLSQDASSGPTLRVSAVEGTHLLGASLGKTAAGKDKTLFE